MHLIKQLILLGHFSRLRARRRLEFQPKFKDLTQTQTMNNKISILRMQYQAETSQPLSPIIHNKNPKLKSQFYVDRTKIQKAMKKHIKQHIDRHNIEAVDEMDDLHLTAQIYPKMHQEQQIDFQEKFKHELFKKKETNRLIKKQQVDPKNYISGKQNIEYLQYLQAKNSLKNNKIKGMMQNKRNNQQLQLLIQSGIIDNPDNLRKIIEKVKRAKDQSYLLQSQKQTKHEENNTTQLMQIKHQLNNKGIIAQLDIPQTANIVKLEQYFQNYDSLQDQHKKMCQDDLQMLTTIKQYENKLFLSRYNEVNFRYKGILQFSHFKQHQICGYLKNNPISPTQLLDVFIQNQERLSKQNLPIITPKVLSTVYSKSSLYKFPETQQNNRINMLNDPRFIRLERILFKNLDKLTNQNFAEAVWSYTKNHEQQYGVLKPQMNVKIGLAIIQELKHRIFQLQQEDLGLILRGIVKISIITNRQIDWTSILNTIEHILPNMNQAYQIQSILVFLSLLPVTERNLELIDNNMHLYNKYEWKQKQTLYSFARVSALMLRYDNIINPGVNKWKSSIKFLVLKKSQEIKMIIPKISINSIPSIMTILERCDIAESKIIDLSKKMVMKNIKQQKQLIKPKKLYSLSLIFSLLDYKRAFKNVTNVMTTLVKTSLLPGKVFTYNSIRFQYYYQLAKLAHSQLHIVDPKVIPSFLLGCSIVQYKNEELYDTIMFETYKKLRLLRQKQKVRIFKQLMILIRCFSLQRRMNQYYKAIIQDIMTEIYDIGNLNTCTPNDLLSFMIAVMSLEGNSMKQITKKLFKDIIRVYIHPFLHKITADELIGLMYGCALLQQVDLANEILRSQTLQDTKLKIQDKFILYLACKALGIDNSMSISKNIEKQYANYIIDQIQLVQKNIGSRYNYRTIKQTLKSELEAQYQIIQQAWSVKVEATNTIFFIASYEHLMMTNKDNNIELSLFGIWKLYPLIYRKQNYHCQIECSFSNYGEEVQ